MFFSVRPAAEFLIGSCHSHEGPAAEFLIGSCHSHDHLVIILGKDKGAAYLAQRC